MRCMTRQSASVCVGLTVGASAAAYYYSDILLNPRRSRVVAGYLRELVIDLWQHLATALNPWASAHGRSAAPSAPDPSVIPGGAPPPAPRCAPLHSLEELLAWRPPSAPDQQHSCTYNAPLLLSPGEGNGRPKLLVCHDMANGYHDDSFIQGATNPNFYRLWHWGCIDSFVYFSHATVAVPPPGWIAAAHRNGVKVLGTFITEWGGGRRICETLLSSTAKINYAADQLVAVALFHGFEGWLINIENTLPVALVPAMLHFVGYLRAAMRKALGPNAMVVWYDAVTIEGWLEWQDKLTPLNQPFFDCADALFVNYTWKASTPSHVAVEAGSARTNVYMGTDVWGRGTYGGGGDNCNASLLACLQAGLSSALFAPAWVYEAFDTKHGFSKRQQEFWLKVESVLPTRPCSSRQLAALPLHTSFSSGAGRRGMWLNGKRVCTRPWFNLSLMGLLPLAADLAAVEDDDDGTCCEEDGADATPERGMLGAAGAGGVVRSPGQGLITLGLSSEDAFNGGGCLAVQGTMQPTVPASWASLKTPFSRYVHVLDTSIKVPPEGLTVQFATRCVSAGCGMALALLVSEPGEGAAAQAAASSPQSLLSDAQPAVSGLPGAGSRLLLLLPAGDEVDGRGRGARGRAAAAAAAAGSEAAAFRASKVPFLEARRWQVQRLEAGPAVSEQACAASSAPSWDLWACHVRGEDLPGDGSTIIGLGVVGWKAGSSDDYRALLGHVSLSAGPLPASSSLTAAAALTVSVLNHHWCGQEAPKATLIKGGLAPAPAEIDLELGRPLAASGGQAGIGHPQGCGGSALLLSCDLVWKPEFDAASGAPLHHGYHVWVLMGGPKQAAITRQLGGEAAAAASRGPPTPVLPAGPTSLLPAPREGVRKAPGPPHANMAVTVDPHVVAEWEHAEAASGALSSGSAESVGWETLSQTASSPGWVLPSPGTVGLVAGSAAAATPAFGSAPASRSSGISASAADPESRRVYLGFALAAIWSVRGLPVQPGAVIGFGVEPVSGQDGLVHGRCEVWADVSMPV